MFSYCSKKNSLSPPFAGCRASQYFCFLLIFYSLFFPAHAAMPISRHNAVVTNLLNQKKELESKWNNVNAEKTKVSNELLAVNAAKVKLNADLANLTKQILALTAEKTSAVNENNKNKNLVATLQSQKAELEQKFKTLEQKAATLEQRYADLEQKNKNQTEELVKVNADLEQKNKDQAEELVKVNEVLQNTNEVLQNTQDELSSVLEVKNKIDEENKRLIDDLTRAQGDFSSLKSDQVALEDKSRAELEENKSALDRLTNDFNLAQTKFDAEIKKSNEESVAMQTVISKKDQEVADLQAKIQAATNAQTEFAKKMEEEKNTTRVSFEAEKEKLQKEIEQISHRLNEKIHESETLALDQHAQDTATQNVELKHMVAIDTLNVEIGILKSNLRGVSKKFKQCMIEKKNADIKYQQQIATAKQKFDEIIRRNHEVEQKNLIKIDILKTALKDSIKKNGQLLMTMNTMRKEYESKITELKQAIIKLKEAYVKRLKARDHVELKHYMRMDSLKTQLNNTNELNAILLQRIQKVQTEKETSDLENQEIIATLQAKIDESIIENQKLVEATDELMQKRDNDEEQLVSEMISVEGTLEELLSRPAGNQWEAVSPSGLISIQRQQNLLNDKPIILQSDPNELSQGLNKSLNIIDEQIPPVTTIDASDGQWSMPLVAGTTPSATQSVPQSLVSTIPQHLVTGSTYSTTPTVQSVPSLVASTTPTAQQVAPSSLVSTIPQHLITGSTLGTTPTAQSTSSLVASTIPTATQSVQTVTTQKLQTPLVAGERVQPAIPQTTTGNASASYPNVAQPSGIAAGSQNPGLASPQDNSVTNAIDSIYQAVWKMTNGDNMQANAAMNAIGAGEELPRKIGAIMEVFREKTDQQFYEKVMKNIALEFNKKKSFTDDILRYSYGPHGDELVRWG
ncbi:MAG: hypothetical protein LBJ92_02845 [Holosporales bacterium]|jgi:chromosome segregation ATPase|nr:hypothetical protein [Holosporales bacterium]